MQVRGAERRLGDARNLFTEVESIIYIPILAWFLLGGRCKRRSSGLSLVDLETSEEVEGRSGWGDVGLVVSLRGSVADKHAGNLGRSDSREA